MGIFNRVLVCGSRDWDDPDIIWQILYGMLYMAQGDWGDNDTEVNPTMTIIEGAASGADSHAHEWALVTKNAEGVANERHSADWDAYGRAAGPIRNQKMLDEGKPEVVLAFTDDLDQSRGTKDMVTRAKKAGLPVFVIGRV